MFKGFREFISRGSVVDLAVGVVIGAAFANVVNGFTTSFLTPVLGLIGGGPELGGKIKLSSTQSITWGAFVSTVIGFLITAGVVYFLVVVPMNKLAQMRKRGEIEEPSAPSEEILLLQEIRDALVAQGRSASDAPVKQRTGQ
jgi:large conductance mechanosensitive channel